MFVQASPIVVFKRRNSEAYTRHTTRGIVTLALVHIILGSFDGRCLSTKYTNNLVCSACWISTTDQVGNLPKNFGSDLFPRQYEHLSRRFSALASACRLP